ncbi:MAG: hypothetical protein IT427_13645 [Pirellulales bacterium]|nr:hypothetical protein [Pirellulales bacterium]
MYDHIHHLVQSGRVELALALLCDRLKADGRWHELFDARLMQSRIKHRLPVAMRNSLDELQEPLRGKIEQAYLDACREVGWKFLERGQLREAWMYLRPLGENESVAAALEKITPTEENAEPLIEILLHEGVAPELGLRMVLDRFGTCNAITAFDSVLAGRSLSVRQPAAALLVTHLHREITENVRRHIETEENRAADFAMLGEMIAGRDWLFGEFSYHIDATHLASVVRAARIIEEPEVLRLALELTEYGCRLHANFHFRGDEPFVDIYPAHRLFFAAQLGSHVEEAVNYFRQRAEAATVGEIGTMPAETWVVLLVRLRRYAEAAQALAKLIPSSESTTGFAPTLFELCGMAGDYSAMLKRCRERDDPVGFTAAMIGDRVVKIHPLNPEPRLPASDSPLLSDGHNSDLETLL